MRYRIFAATVAVITFTGIGTVMAAGPARAMMASPGMSVRPAIGTTALAGSFHICLLNAPSLCLQSNGPGNQVTITSGSSANFQVVNEAPDGQWRKYQFENGSGNCLRAGTGGVVKIENGSCGNGDADWWEDAGTEIVSVLYGSPMLTHGAVSGYNVWWGAPQSGDWLEWTGQPVTTPG